MSGFDKFKFVTLDSWNNTIKPAIISALGLTEGFRDEAETFAVVAQRGIKVLGRKANTGELPGSPELGDAWVIEVSAEDRIYVWDNTEWTWFIIGSIAWGEISGSITDQVDLQTALDAKANLAGGNSFTDDQILSGDLLFSGTAEVGRIPEGVIWNANNSSTQLTPTQAPLEEEFPLGVLWDANNSSTTLQPIS